MRKSQLGVSIGGLMLVSVVLIAVAMLGLKLMPSYIEFFAIKKAVVSVASQKRGGTVTEVRKSFDAQAVIDDINSIKGSDLEVTKEGSDLVVVAAYRKEIPLFGKMGVYIEFRASSKE